MSSLSKASSTSSAVMPVADAMESLFWSMALFTLPLTSTTSRAAFVTAAFALPASSPAGPPMPAGSMNTATTPMTHRIARPNNAPITFFMVAPFRFGPFPRVPPVVRRCSVTGAEVGGSAAFPLKQPTRECPAP